MNTISSILASAHRGVGYLQPRGRVSPPSSCIYEFAFVSSPSTSFANVYQYIAAFEGVASGSFILKFTDKYVDYLNGC